MSLVHEAAERQKLPKVGDLLRQRYAELIDTYGERLPYGHNMPIGFREASRFVRSLILRLTPNLVGLSISDMVDRAQVNLTSRYEDESVKIWAVSQYASAKDSNWIFSGIDGADEFLVLRKGEKPKIKFLDTTLPMEVEATQTYLLKYIELYAELRDGLKVKKLISED